MALTTEGFRTRMEFYGLQDGDGFTVKLEAGLETGNDEEKRKAERVAQRENVLGLKLNGHEDTFGAAQTRLANAINSFKNELTQFISAWNNGDFPESPNHQSNE